ncbi:MAG: carbohydrate ABC transporter permease [Chloroflexota bacterium]
MAGQTETKPRASDVTADGGRPAASGRIGENHFFRWAFLLPTVLILLVIAIFPMVNSIWNSMHWYTLSQPDQKRFIFLENYGQLLFRDSIFWDSMKTTILYSLGAVGLQFIIGLAIALLMDRRMKGIGLLRTLFMIPILVSPVVSGLTWRFMYEPSGLINWLMGLIHLPPVGWISTPGPALPAVIITDVWQWTPFFVLVLLAGIQSIPREVVEAAALDGLSSGQYLWKILLPLIRPVALVVLLIRMMDTIRIFDAIYILTGGGPAKATLIGSIYTYVLFFKAFDAGVASALSWIIVILVNILGFFLLRFLAQESTQEQKGLAPESSPSA